MKRRQVLRMALSLLLTLSMLLSLPLYLYAADSHPGREYDTTYAVYPTAPYTYSTHPSPDGSHYLRVRHNVVDGVTYYDEFAILETAGDVLLRAVDLHVDYGVREGVSQYDPLWSPDGRFVVFSSPEDGYLYPSVRILDVEERDYWIPASATDNYNAMKAKDPSLYQADNRESVSPMYAEKWLSGNRVSFVTEYVFGSERLWGRFIFDAEKNYFVSRALGDAYDIDDPKNPIWTKAEGIGAPAYNNGDFSVTSPDGSYIVTVNAADNLSDGETWGAMYESVLLPYPGGGMTEVMLYRVHGGDHVTKAWNDITLKFSPDSRYVVMESSAPDAECLVYDVQTGNLRNLYRRTDAQIPQDVLGTDARVWVEAFSVFGRVMYVTEYTAPDGEVYQVRNVDPLDRGQQYYGRPYLIGEDDRKPDDASAQNPTTKDGFEGFIAVSKTHKTGLDGLFRIGEQYKYIHMEAGVIPYSEYVSDAAADADLLFDRYRVVRSDEGVWVLDENENVVYAGVGAVFEFGQLALTYADAEGENSLWRVGGDSFRLILDRITEMAAQEDGSVYVIHTVGKGPFETGMLSHVDADGTVTTIGEYDGDLSEFRRIDQRG